jgi:hypothetical protein
MSVNSKISEAAKPLMAGHENSPTSPNRRQEHEAAKGRAQHLEHCDAGDVLHLGFLEANNINFRRRNKLSHCDPSCSPIKTTYIPEKYIGRIHEKKNRRPTIQPLGLLTGWGVPASVNSTGGVHPNKAANALIWAGDSGLRKTVAYLSKASKVMEASSAATPSENIKAFLLLDHLDSCC